MSTDKEPKKSGDKKEARESKNKPGILGRFSEVFRTTKEKLAHERLISNLKKEKEKSFRLFRSLREDLSRQLTTQGKKSAETILRNHETFHAKGDGNNIPNKEELDVLFKKIDTDNLRYPFRRLFPNFIRVCESSRLGKNVAYDVLGLAVGIGESLASIMMLGGHFAIDIVRFLRHPRQSLQTVRDLEN